MIPVRPPTIQEFLDAKNTQEFWIGFVFSLAMCIGLTALLAFWGLVSLNREMSPKAASNQIGGAGVVAGNTGGNIVVNDKDTITEAFGTSMNAAIEKQKSENMELSLNPMAHMDKSNVISDVELQVMSVTASKLNDGEFVAEYSYNFTGQDPISMITFIVGVYRDDLRIGTTSIATGSVFADKKEYKGLSKFDTSELPLPFSQTDRLIVERVIGM
ncbi:hypothetical protein [Vibrio cyclitrophicus]|uniref:hypothetical protein n=1 Tax=Vibrio cyclitrophicus TaxID=47951 RepID=UPI0002ECBEB6|nr:hypothetical protein [Vibrio cyclitrophicus]OCH45450.1 hypothetical protein A6E07_04270 [Vibrio cyclitrophicus]OEE11228.1 hypothetical protein OC5_00475 [Vibrio cyclitrophicus ZF264]OEE85522.1 hypothetical protein OAI_17645 [Vibrio cyclitrophicus FF160]OEF28015.1 hypothetical protein OA9_02040 [Vibrio cyclitrophicus 1F97]OEF51616.1 hypothetical protein OAC_03050 [Vibrio cyclitrophicus 1F273]